MSKKFEHLYDVLFIKPGSPIYNDEIRKVIHENNFFSNLFSTESNFKSIDCQEEYLNYFPKWINSSKLNTVLGLSTFPYRMVSLGATQTLDSFHYEMLIKGKRIRVFKGEYPYHQQSIPWTDDQYIENNSIAVNDAVIISFPFCGTGEKHEAWEWLLDECLKKDVPVLVDCAYFGTCGGLSINLSHSAITDVVFSLTKGLACSMYRNGIRFSKNKSGKMQIQTTWHHGIHLNLKIALFLMNSFSPDYNYKKFRPLQEVICQKYGLIPTPCTHLAMGNSDWNYFLWGDKYIRIGIKNAIEEF